MVNKMNKTKLREMISETLGEAYYGSIPPPPELPAGYGGAVDRAKVQQHLSDEIDDEVRSGKLNIDGLSIETVRANQEIPWDKFQAIDDEVLGDIIRDYKRKKSFYREGTETKLKQIIREELTMMTNEDDPFEFYRDLHKDLYGRNPDTYPSDENIYAEIEALTFIEDTNAERDKYRREMDAATATPPDADTEKPLPPKFSGMGRRIKENKMNIKQIIREELRAVLKEGFVSATGDTPEDVAAVVRRWMADENIDSNDEQAITDKITNVAFDAGVIDDDIPDWQDAVFDMLGGAVNEEELQNYLNETEASKCKQMLDNGEISTDQYKACVDQYEKDYGEVEDTGARAMYENRLARIIHEETQKYLNTTN